MKTLEEIDKNFQNLKDFENFLSVALWNQSGGYQQIIVLEHDDKTFTLVDDCNRFGSLSLETTTFDNLVKGVTSENTVENYDLFWRNYQHHWELEQRIKNENYN